MTRTRITLAAAILSVLVSAAPAAAYSRGEGRSSEAPGQERAAEACDELILNQRNAGRTAGGGPKAPTEDGTEAPTNCDHYWQSDGFIGNSE
ncbi:MAG: hypothetical protein M3198_12630 [Actinomycetota bacterium]|nr:hypothetical protein [Actinomycetota bacterium]